MCYSYQGLAIKPFAVGLSYYENSCTYTDTQR
jgi:hypothetical protein